MSRLREGRANTARGGAHFLRETVGRVRYAGARGQLTVRADSGFYTHSVVSVCRCCRFALNHILSPGVAAPAGLPVGPGAVVQRVSLVWRACCSSGPD